jgi:hypothetical protein
MASERKPLFIQSPEGYHEEVATTDYMTIAKLTIPTSGAGGVGIVMNGNKVTGAGPATTAGDVLVYGQNNAQLGSTQFTSNVDLGHNLINNVLLPLAPDDAANKAYVDSLAQGLDPHEACVAKTNRGLGTQAIRAGATGGSVSLPMAGETFDIQLHGGVVVTVTFTTEANLTAVAATINTAAGAGTAIVNGSNIDLYDSYYGTYSQVIVSNVTEGTPGDLVGKTGISAGTTNGVGFTFTHVGPEGTSSTLEAPTSATSWNTIDGALLTLNARVLVSMQGGADNVANLQNGIYYVAVLGDGASAKFKLERATDCDIASPTEFHAGTFTLIISGSTYTNTGWDCSTTIVAVDTTPNVWSQFSGAPSYSYDQGLIRIISSIQVDLDTAASEQGTGAAGGSSGLEFDVNTASGKLRAKVDQAKGIRRFANGLGIKLDGSTAALDVGGAGSGLSVAGLPNLFTIGGTATSQTPGTGQVTATNLNTLTAGASSNADALHTHTGLVATSAPILKADMDATGGTVAVKDPVFITGTNNIIDEGRADTDAKSRIIGVAQANPSGDIFTIVYAGKALGVITGLSGAGAGVPVYLATAGGLSTTLPGASNRVIQVGICLNADDLFVRIVDYGKKAA